MLFNEYRRDIVHHYFNLSYKIPVKIPRKIIKCTGFVCPKKLEAGLNLLENKITRGEDLLPHLSREIFDPTYRNFMLYDFGIIHFHLGIKPSKENKLLLESTNELVYALIDYDICYFIKIDNHDKWDDIGILSLLKKDFPKVLDRWKIEGKPIHKITMEERKLLIKSCINTFFEIDGEYYMSLGMGMNTAGTSSLAVMNMNNNFNYYFNLQEKIINIIKDDLNKIEEKINFKLLEMNLELTEIDPIIILDHNNKLQISIVDNGKIFEMEIKKLY
jgi:hypothetical protein